MSDVMAQSEELALKALPNYEIETVTGATFAAVVLQGRGPMVVEFMSYGCAHCRALEPILEQVAAMLKTQERFFRINTAVDPELADSYGIKGTPTLIMILNGNEMGRVEGPHPSVSSVLNAITQSFDL